MKRKPKTAFICQACGYESPKWLGKCPDCGQWDSFTEEAEAAPGGGPARAMSRPGQRARPIPIDAVELADEERISTRIREFDRVLGGGLVNGTLVLIGGDPGIGKSTLMLQALHGLARGGHRVLYVSGEESIRQIRLRSRRLDAVDSNLFVVSEVDMDTIMGMTENEKPDVLVIDSIQTMYNPELSSAPGSVTQVRESAVRLMLMAKRSGVPVFIVGHVTKEGAIAGPRLLEHMVDTVLYFEGDRSHVFRILRAVKNRFGSTNEIGVFEMREGGLAEVPNPSAVFLSERPDGAPGSVVTACMEGTRPILVELQALASSTNFGTPRRTILGLDPNRVALLVAVLEKRLGMHLMGHDIFMNVAGGVKVHEPAVDLAVIAAVASSFTDRSVPQDTIVMGEVGLTGEVRAVSHLETRVVESRKMGFTRALVPRGNLERLKTIPDIEVLGIRTVDQAVETLF
ncbi:MAG: DNA repair protein RadA [Desulfococcaceae bacterium]